MSLVITPPESAVSCAKSVATSHLKKKDLEASGAVLDVTGLVMSLEVLPLSLGLIASKATQRHRNHLRMRRQRQISRGQNEVSKGCILETSQASDSSEVGQNFKEYLDDGRLVFGTGDKVYRLCVVCTENPKITDGIEMLIMEG